MSSNLSDTIPFNILLVEDNPGDARLAREALNENNINHFLYHVEDGLQALDFLHNKGMYRSSPRPDLILLDLNLPKINGHQVLSEIKSDENLRKIPVMNLPEIAFSVFFHSPYYLLRFPGLSGKKQWKHTMTTQPSGTGPRMTGHGKS